jgi:glycosyltransferase involved in cell wall biosynthesis
MAKRRGWHFRVIGGGGYEAEVSRQLGVDTMRLSSTTWRPLCLHHFIVASLDVGIVPLADTAFNAAKSWLKGLEYAAMGIPFVASHLPEYELLRDRGIGILAHSKAKSWNRALSGLMDNPERDALGREYRTIVANDLTIRSHAWRWPEAWRSAWLRRRTQRAIHHKENHVRQTP